MRAFQNAESTKKSFKSHVGMAKLKVRRFTYSWEYSGFYHQLSIIETNPDPLNEKVGDTQQWSHVGLVFSLLVD